MDTLLKRFKNPILGRLAKQSASFSYILLHVSLGCIQSMILSFIFMLIKINN